MISTIINLLCFILILGIIVFIHEFGHFLWAKHFGVYCYEFSLGFGPKLFSFRRKNDETLYCFRIFPIGGYVSMAGEEVDDDKKVPKNKKLYNKKWYQKLLIVLAGILHNFILGFVLLFMISLIHGSLDVKPIIGIVVKDSASEKAGIKVDDEIVRLNGKKISTWDELTVRLIMQDNEKAQSFTIKRENKEIVIKVKPTKIKDKKGNISYSYGIGSKDEVHHGFLNALKYAFYKFTAIIKTLVLTIGGLVTGKIGLSSLSGPVGIYSIVGDQRQAAGIQGLVFLLAYLSVNVGFVNLLPFPAFDGYRAVTIIIEKITGKKVNAKVDAIVNTIGLILLFGLMILITIKDVINLF